MGIIYDPNTGEPIETNDNMESETSSRTNSKIIISIGILLGALIIVVVVWGSGVFLSNSMKIKKACISTFNFQTEFTKDLKPIADIFKKNDYTVDISFSNDEIGNIKSTYVCDDKNSQINIVFSNRELPTDISVLGGIDDKCISLEVPQITDKLFTYNYMDRNKNGYLVNKIEDIEKIDSLIENFYNSNKNNVEYQKKIAGIVYDKFNELVFEKCDAKEFKIDGKIVKSSGYFTNVDNDFYMNLFDDLAEVYLDENKDLIDTVYGSDNSSIKKQINDIRNEINNIPDIKLYFYIYKGKLASILAENEKDESFEILFKGGDYRAQNITILSDNEEVIAFSGKTRNDKETYRIEKNEEIVCDLSYGKDGKFELDVYDYNGMNYIIGSIESAQNEINIVLDTIYFDNESFASTIDIKKGGKIMPYSNSNEFDVGNANEEDFLDLINSVDLKSLFEYRGIF